MFSTNTVYTDNIIELHTPPAGVNSQWTYNDGKDVGFRFHYYTAGTDTNAALVLDNATKELHWYNSGAESLTGDFNSSTYGIFKTGSIKLAGGSSVNDATSGDLQVAGGVGIGGGLFVNGTTTSTNAYVSTNLTASAITATNVNVAHVYGNIYLTQYSSVFAQGNGSQANVLLQASANNLAYGIGLFAANGAINSLYSSGAINFTTGRTVRDRDTPTGGNTFMALSTSGVLTLTGNVASTATTNGTLVITGGAGISGALYLGATSYINGEQILTTATLGQYTGQATSISAGTDTAVSTSTGAITIWNTSTLQSITDRGSFTTNAVSFRNTTDSYSTATGALLVNGGVGIGGSLYVGTASYISGSLILTTATVNLYSNQTTISAGTDTAVSTSSGSITVWNTSTLQSITNRGSTTTNSVSITNTTAATSTSTGALTVRGGLGVAGDLYVGGTVNATNFVGAFSGTISGTSHRTISGVYTATGTTQVIIDSFSTSTFRSANYTIQMTSPLGYHVCSLNVIHNGISSDCIQFGDIRMGTTVGTFTSIVVGGNVQIAMTPLSTGTTNVVFVKTLLNIA